MRLINELWSERGLTAIINIHDVLLAQMFAQRIVGLANGEVVYDGKPEGLTPEVLTQIYGEEDWTATIEKVDEEDEEEWAPWVINKSATIQPFGTNPLLSRIAYYDGE